MTPAEPTPLAEYTIDRLSVFVHETREAAGLAASITVARAIADRQPVAGTAHVVFAAAPSQDEFLAALAARTDVDWRAVRVFHMDEYLGLGPDHPASFRRYLRTRLFDPVGLDDGRLRLIPGESQAWPSRTCLDYETALRAEPPDVVCAGVGENGHLAFNDPPVADFLDPVWVKVVRLDPACRAQQVHDGAFGRLDDVPAHAFTLTVPALLSAGVVSAVVPGPRKARAVRDMLWGPVGEACPATALRTHPGARLYLDRDSAALL